MNLPIKKNLTIPPIKTLLTKSKLLLVDRFFYTQPLGDPLFGHLFSKDQLVTKARQLALSQNETSLKMHQAAKVLRLEFLLRRKQLLFCYKNFDHTKTSSMSSTGQWLLDNKRVILLTSDHLKTSLTPAFLERLPVVKPEEEQIRIWALASELCLASNFQITLHRLLQFLTSYQKETPLTISELWAVPVVLEYILLDNLTRVAATVLAEHKAASESDLEKLAKNVILSVHAIQRLDWPLVFEQLSAVEKILRTDPAGVYPQMDFPTRDQYRHILEEVYYATERDQQELAHWLIRTARERKKFQDSLGHEDHIGYYLFGQGREEFEMAFAYDGSRKESLLRFFRRHATIIYPSSLLLVTGLFLLVFEAVIFKLIPDFSLSALLVLLILLAIPGFHVARLVLNFLDTRVFLPEILPKMDTERPVLAKNRTMVVIPTLLIDAGGEPENLLSILEKNCLANKDPNIFWGLLLAFSETKAGEGKATPAEARLLEKTLEGVKALNKKYDSEKETFFVFFRERQWNESEESWLEWERKRGKILEFNQLLRGNTKTSFAISTADSEFLQTIHYVITIDRDVFLPRDSAKRLIATISHPLNEAVIDPETNKVVTGFGIIQPRLGLSLQNGNRSLLSGLLSEPTGWDSYSGVVADVFQDLFHESFYLGKGIYDVDTFNKVLYKRLPVNLLLSHDHLEGFYLRTGFASDIQIFEDFPVTYSSYISRLQRWIRGDWQRLGWIGNTVRNEDNEKVANPLVFYQRWKLLEDALHSLVIPNLLVVNLVSLVFFPQTTTAVLGLLFGVVSFGPVLTFLTSFGRKPDIRTWRFSVYRFLKNGLVAVEQILFSLIFLVHQGLACGQAISLSLYRMLFSKKRLLEWVTFHQVALAGGRPTFIGYVQSMAMAQGLALGVVVFVFFFRSAQQPAVMPLAVLWLAAPFIASKMSLQRVGMQTLFSTTETRLLRSIARVTWRFFTEFVSSDSHWLPPDHYQETKQHPQSAMTSITNIGMYFLACLSAFDLGIISPVDAIDRLGLAFDSLSKLRRFKGHFFNWYSISTLATLAPAYISTVDSGNLAAALLAVKTEAQDFTKRGIIEKKTLDGVGDCTYLLHKELEKVARLRPQLKVAIKDITAKTKDLESFYSAQQPSNLVLWYQLLHRIKQLYVPISDLVYSLKDQLTDSEFQALNYWNSQTVLALDDALRTLLVFAPWLRLEWDFSTLDQRLTTALEGFSQLQTIDELENQYKRHLTSLQDWQGSYPSGDAQFEKIQELILGISEGLSEIARIRAIASSLATKAEEFVREMDFRFLYNKERGLFHVGYNLSRKRFDRYHYELLVSEARLSSFIAIAKDDVSLKHWSRLGRTFTANAGRVGLLSWGGSLFECLFPLLVMPNVADTVLAETYRTYILGHIDYAQSQGFLWGISESSYGLTGRDGTYRYKLHGVPFFGLRQVDYWDNVVSPYSSFLALEILPKESLENITNLENAGLLGKFGFYEAIDYTVYQNETTEKIVRTFLCHHQGSILASITNVLANNSIKKRFLSDERIQATLFVLEEKMPATVELATRIDQEVATLPVSEEKPAHQEIYAKDLHYKTAPIMHVLSNGTYKVVLSNRGGGYSQYRALGLTRWRNDPTFDDYGFFCYLSDETGKNYWSTTFLPTYVEPDSYEVYFDEQYAKVTRSDFGITTSVQTIVPKNENLELRILNLTNENLKKNKQITLTSYLEVALSYLGEDLSHPSFYRMQVESSFLPQANALVFHRKSIDASLPHYFLHQVVASGLSQSVLEYETSRLQFLGRGRSLQKPLALERNNLPLTKTTGFVLDPVAAFRFTIDLAPLETKTIYFVNTVANTANDISSLAQKYYDSAAFSQIRKPSPTDYFFTHAAELKMSQHLLSCLLYKKTSLTGLSATPPFVLLKKLGISETMPLICLSLTENSVKSLFRELVQICVYLLAKGTDFTLVILVSENSGYFQPEYDEAQKIVSETIASFTNQFGDQYTTAIAKQIMLFKTDEVSPEEFKLLGNLSVVSLKSNHGNLAEQLDLEYHRL